MDDPEGHYDVHEDEFDGPVALGGNPYYGGRYYGAPAYYGPGYYNPY